MESIVPSLYYWKYPLSTNINKEQLNTSWSLVSADLQGFNILPCCCDVCEHTSDHTQPQPSEELAAVRCVNHVSLKEKWKHQILCFTFVLPQNKMVCANWSAPNTCTVWIITFRFILNSSASYFVKLWGRRMHPLLVLILPGSILLYSVSVIWNVLVKLVMKRWNNWNCN